MLVIRLVGRSAVFCAVGTRLHIRIDIVIRIRAWEWAVGRGGRLRIRTLGWLAGWPRSGRSGRSGPAWEHVGR